MPIFEYRCEDCGRSFEKLVLSIEASAAACLHCGSGRVKKLFSAFATTGGALREAGSGPIGAGVLDSGAQACSRCGSMNPCGMS
jgi:putative FmdB family regulatory protein